MMQTDTLSSPKRVVGFTRMAEGTREDYALLAELEAEFNRALPDRLLDAVRALQASLGGYQVSRYEHSLQSATRAYRDGQDEDYVVAALLHDIGDSLAPYTHGEMVAAILKPYLSARVCWVVKYHGLFQMYYYAHHYGEDPNLRDRYKDHPWYADGVEFCAKYDQNCFDPNYDSLPLEFFVPMVRRVFSRPPGLTPTGIVSRA